MNRYQKGISECRNIRKWTRVHTHTYITRQKVRKFALLFSIVCCSVQFTAILVHMPVDSWFFIDPIYLSILSIIRICSCCRQEWKSKERYSRALRRMHVEWVTIEWWGVIYYVSPFSIDYYYCYRPRKYNNAVMINNQQTHSQGQYNDVRTKQYRASLLILCNRVMVLIWFECFW